MLALIVTNLSWLSICCASQAFVFSRWHLHLCQKLCSYLCSVIFLTIFVSRCVHINTQCNVCLVFLSQHRLRLQGGSTSLCRTALGTETSPSHPGDRAGLVQGQGKESAVGERVAAAAGWLGQPVLSDTGSQVVSVVASKGGDKRWAGKRGHPLPASIAPVQVAQL